MTDKPSPEQIEQWGDEADAILEALKPVLRGHNPQAMGLALAEATAMWIAGHHDEATQSRLLHMQYDTVRDMLPMYRTMMQAARALKKGGGEK